MASLLRLPLLALFAALPGAALAHHAMGGEAPTGAWQGLLSGLAHPVLGPDHLAFIVGVGLVAALMRAGPLLPVAAMAAMAMGALLRVAGLGLPGAEALVALSVGLVGLAVLVPAGRAARPVAGLAAAAGALHGYALAESIVGAEPTPLLAYLLGLALVQAALSLGVYALARRASARGRLPALAPRLAGAAILLVGVVLLGMVLLGGTLLGGIAAA